MLKGYKDTLMEYFNVIFAAMIIVLLLGVTAVAVQVSDNKTFIAYADDIVSRYGAVTEEAQIEIQKHSDEHFDGKYSVIGGTEEVQRYDDPVDYEIEGRFRMFFFNLPFGMNFSETTYSRVRTENIDFSTYTYVINFVDYDGTLIESSIQNRGQYPTTPANPTRYSYTFTGWDPTVETEIVSNMSFKATYERNKYTVTFNKNGATSADIPNQIITHDQKVVVPNVPTRAGYDFLGWFSNLSDAVSDVNNPIVRNTTFTAKWRLKTYAVTFNANGGASAPASQTKTWGQTLTLTSSVPTRTGYDFTGWNTAANGSGTSYASGASYTANSGATLYAQWSIKKYTVQFNVNGGTSAKPANQTINHGSKATAPANPTRTGYTFNGWSPSIANAITGNTTFVAQWTINRYTATFNSSGGSAVAPQTVNHGSTVTTPSNPTRSGYRFSGWSPALTTTMTQNRTFTAQWVKTEEYIYVLNSFGDGGTSSAYGFSGKTGFNLVSGGNYYAESSGYINQQAANDGKSLAVYVWNPGWTLSASVRMTSVGTRQYAGIYFTSPANTPITVTGYMYPSGGSRTGAVTWQSTNLYLDNPKGGSIWKTTDNGTQLTLPSPQASKDGHSFGGWLKNTDGVTYAAGARTPITAKTTFTAQWRANTYTVAFNNNGGTGSPGNQTKTYGTNLTLSSTRPTRAGYTFVNWNTAANGSGTSYASGATYTANAGVTLYAQWRINTYSVTFNANGGSGAPAAQTKTYGTNLTLTNSVPTRTGYNFARWNTASNGSGTNYARAEAYTANANVTLYAQWTPQTKTSSGARALSCHATRYASGSTSTCYNDSYTTNTYLTYSTTSTYGANSTVNAVSRYRHVSSSINIGARSVYLTIDGNKKANTSWRVCGRAGLCPSSGVNTHDEAVITHTASRSGYVGTARNFVIETLLPIRATITRSGVGTYVVGSDPATKVTISVP